MEHDGIYFSRRAIEERAAAAIAGHPNAKQAHLELADRYEDMAIAISGRGPRAIDDPVVISNEMQLQA